MSFADRMVHSLTHRRTPGTSDGETDLDDYNQPVPGTPIETAIRGLVQPRAVRELADARNAGAEIGDHIIFLPIMDVDASDSFLYDGDLYNVTGVRKFAFGRTPHLEVDAQKVDNTLLGQ